MLVELDWRGWLPAALLASSAETGKRAASDDEAVTIGKALDEIALRRLVETSL